MLKNRILVAPLNWGLGHATRCIPVIKELVANGFIPVLASNGAALDLLREEFPHLEHYPLPGYNIKYSRSKRFFRLKLFFQLPHILRTIRAEKKTTEKLIREKNISGIISDNRWGVRSSLVPSAFMTHQINVLSGSFTYFSSKIHRYYIKKFDECWVPDVAGKVNLSGRMGHPVKPDFPIKYLGILSRMKKEIRQEKFDISVILSGPEPQRSILENIVYRELKDSGLKILLVQGLVEKKQETSREGNFVWYNFLTSKELQDFMNASKKIVCRSGYSGVMDLVKLEKPALLIPTPGQYEQEYLAKRLQEEGFFASCPQKDFNISRLEETESYSRSFRFLPTAGLRKAFALFQRK